MKDSDIPSSFTLGFDVNKKSSSQSESNNFDNNQSTINKILSDRWIKILFVFILVSLFFLLFQFLGNTFGSLIIVFLPLFFGYGLATMLKPIINFFNRYFSRHFSIILAVIFFASIILIIVIGLGITFFVFLDNILQDLIFSSTKGKAVLDKIVPITERIEEVKIQHNTAGDFYTLTINYSAIDQLPKEEIYSSNEVGGIYTIIFYFIQLFPHFKYIGFDIINSIYESTESGYVTFFTSNISVIISLLYVFLFSLLFMFFAAFNQPDKFFNFIWRWLTNNLDEFDSLDLANSLKNNLKGWLKGFLIDQTYILLGTGFFIFLTGVIFENTSLNDPSYVFVLTIFMFLANTVPYIGPWIGIGFIGGIGLVDVVKFGPGDLESWIPFIFLMAGVLLVQFFESILVVPMAYSYAVNISPISVILIISATGVLFGIFAMPFAIPIAITIKTLLKKIYKTEWTI